MFNQSQNFVVNGGNFNVTNHGCKVDSMDILEKRIAAGAFHNSSERYDSPQCHPHTRLAVLEVIMDWIKDGQQTSFLMWLYGPAGAGKSAIAQTIAEMCQKLDYLAASFFWSRSAAGRNDETRLIATLAYQLIITIPQMRMHVLSAIETDPAIFSRSVQAQMEILISNPMAKAFPDGEDGTVEFHQPRLIILDGLDECGEPRVQSYILKVVTTAVQQFPLHFNVLIASRPEHGIRNFFAGKPMPSLTNKLCLDDKYFPDNDIRLFLVESFQSLKETHVLGTSLPESWPGRKDIDGIVQRSSGQFIYAATVIKFVRSPRRRPDEQLKIIFGLIPTGKQTPYSELDALYLHIFSTVEDLPRVLDILSCLFLYGVSLMDNIAELLLCDRLDLHLMLSDLHSVLNVPDISVSGELFVFHASLEDFLMDPNRSGVFFLDQGLALARMTQNLIRHIHKFPKPATDRILSTVDHIVIDGFVSTCQGASPTLELLQDFRTFDLKHWVSTTRIWWHKGALIMFKEVVELTAWFRSHDSAAGKENCSEISLYDCHAHERGRAIDQSLSIFFSSLELDNQTILFERASHQMPALAHPLLANKDNRSIMRNILASLNELGRYSKVLAVWSVLDDMSGECAEEVQQFLLKRSCDGTWYVDGSRYAKVSLEVANSIIKICNDPGYPCVRKKTVQLAIDTLPFYLSYSEYSSQLVEYFHDHRLNPARLEDICPGIHITPALNAIEIYLKKKPHGARVLERQLEEKSEPDVPRKRQRR